MAKPKKIRNGKDVTKAVLKHTDWPIRHRKGSHRTAKLPDGRLLTWAESNKDFRPGMRTKIVKVLKAFSLPVMILILGLIVL